MRPDIIRKLRKERGLKQKELAKLADVTARTIRDYELGRVKNLNSRTLELISSVLFPDDEKTKLEKEIMLEDTRMLVQQVENEHFHNTLYKKILLGMLDLEKSDGVSICCASVTGLFTLVTKEYREWFIPCIPAFCAALKLSPSSSLYPYETVQLFEDLSNTLERMNAPKELLEEVKNGRNNPDPVVRAGLVKKALEYAELNYSVDLENALMIIRSASILLEKVDEKISIEERLNLFEKLFNYLKKVNQRIEDLMKI